MFLELLIQVLADSDVLEHPLQFGRVLEATCLLRHKENREGAIDTLPHHNKHGALSCAMSHLQLGDHAGLGVVAGAVLVDQTLGEHLGVELLEDVFVLNVLEHNHLADTQIVHTLFCVPATTI